MDTKSYKIIELPLKLKLITITRILVFVGENLNKLFSNLQVDIYYNNKFLHLLTPIGLPIDVNQNIVAAVNKRHACAVVSPPKVIYNRCLYPQ